MKNIFHEFVHGFFHVDHGILLTMLALIRNPGQTLKDYIHGHRIRYFNPFTFILITGGITAFLLPRVHWNAVSIDLGILSKRQVNMDIWNTSLKHFSFRLLLLIPLYALVSRVFYYKKEFNFSEHLVANTYIRGMLSVLIILFAPLQVLLHAGGELGTAKAILLVLTLSYSAWAYAGLFENRITVAGLAKGFITVFVSMFFEFAIISLILNY